MNIEYKKLNNDITFINGAPYYKSYCYSRMRSAKIARAKDVATHTEEEWFEMVDYFDHLCLKCYSSDFIGGLPTKDHIIPIHEGGTDSIRNIQPLCRECNVSTGREIYDYRVDFCNGNDLNMPPKWCMINNIDDIINQIINV